MKVHVFEEYEGWEVWLDLIEDHDGLCVGSGATKQAALEEAVHALEQAIATIQAGEAKVRI